ncbi:response regulator transcription factor [Roseomonas frigidaquae]|uniref:Response regulator transcription factor n=1 Tax=Falsiroseomonas frigidaquae TaxID=487318 RepID=A0ABX1EVU1_9PROT|nr:response regulator transcription factor [Falsiroseomonas frigidaquae]NKE43325.1 response regulator transcription factor [Falsiroseomonas frigidaquae]
MVQLLLIADLASSRSDLAARLSAAGVTLRSMTAAQSAEAMTGSDQTGQAMAAEALHAGADMVDGIVIDCPDLRGTALPLLRGLRQTGLRLPVILLTATPAPGEEAEAFNLGADAVLGRKAPAATLLARIAAIQRRAPARKAATLRCGNVVLDRASSTLSVDGQPVEVTPYELNVLDMLMSARGGVLSKDRISEALHDGDAEAAAGVLRVFICRLRRKLAERNADDIIRTVWGVGYRVEAPAAAPGHAASHHALPRPVASGSVASGSGTPAAARA